MKRRVDVRLSVETIEKLENLANIDAFHGSKTAVIEKAINELYSAIHHGLFVYVKIKK